MLGGAEKVSQSPYERLPTDPLLTRRGYFEGVVA
jgi:hypothetical protein